MNIIHISPNAQEIESWVAIIDNQVVGHIFMKIDTNNRVKFLDAWVHNEHRRKGIYRQLWETRWDYVREHYKGYTVYAWCKNASLPLLVEKGFTTGEIATYVEYNIPQSE